MILRLNLILTLLAAGPALAANPQPVPLGGAGFQPAWHLRTIGPEHAADHPAAALTPNAQGERVYADHCARCHDHAADPHPPAGIDTRPFDFRRCDAASAEPLEAWRRAIRKGGRVVGLSADMPAFETRLSAGEIDLVARYLRGRCTARGWPDGDLNLPRPILTEKAFPEDEVVVLPAVSHAPAGGGEAALAVEVEKRLGRRSMVEAGVPAAAAWGAAASTAGIGDVSLAFKHVLHADRFGTRILSAGMEAAFPTARGPGVEGGDRVIFEPFLAAGLRLGAIVLEASMNAELPSGGGEREFGYGLYIGRELAAAAGAWTVGAELTGEGASLGVAPQVRRRLTRTGALAAGFGVRVPVTGRDAQSLRWLGYLSWDYRERVRARR